MKKKSDLGAIVSDYLLNNTSMLGYFERFENDEDLLEEKLEEFCTEVDALVEELIEVLESDNEDIDDDEYS